MKKILFFITLFITTSCFAQHNAAYLKDGYRVKPKATAPSNPKESQVYYDDGLKKYLYHDGTSWVEFASSSTPDVPQFSDIYSDNAIIEGGIIHLHDLVYNVWVKKFIINGVTYTESLSQDITLSAADAILNRIDVFYVEKIDDATPATLGVLEGDLNADPVKPTINVLYQTEISFKLLLANETTDTTVSTSMVYDEGIEWSINNATTGIDTTITSTAYNGSKSILIPNGQTGSLEFQNSSHITYDANGYFIMAIKLNEVWPAGGTIGGGSPTASILKIKFNDTPQTTSSTLWVNRYILESGGLDSTNTTSWQLVQIPQDKWDYGTAAKITDQIDTVTFSFLNIPSMYVDYIQFQGNLNYPPETQFVQEKDIDLQEKTIEINDIQLSGTGTKEAQVAEYLNNSGYIKTVYNSGLFVKVNNSYLFDTGKILPVELVPSAAGLAVSDDGTVLYASIHNSSCIQYSLSTPFDVSTATQIDTNATLGQGGALYVTKDGMHVVYSNRDLLDGTIDIYSMSTAHDMSTLSLVSTVQLPINISNQEAYITEDGINLYVSHSTGINHYILSTPWDVTTYSLNETLATTNNFGFDFSDDMKTLLRIEYSTSKIVQYNLSIAGDLSTAVANSKKIDISSFYTGNYPKLFLSKDGKKLIVSQYGSPDIATFYLPSSNTVGDLVTVTDTTFVNYPDYYRVSNHGKGTLLHVIESDIDRLTRSVFDSDLINEASAGSYTDEQAQDAVGGMVANSSEINITYNDATPSVSASLVTGGITLLKLDATIQTSLGKADSALQPGDIDGSETKVNAGTNVTVTGAGTTGDPYVINSTSSGHTIQDNGTPMTARSNLNFKGAVTVDDNSGNNSTDVTFQVTGGFAANQGYETMTATGGETEWVLTNTPVPSTNNMLFIGGSGDTAYTLLGTSQYSLSGNTLTLSGSAIPSAGDILKFYYAKGTTAIVVGESISGTVPSATVNLNNQGGIVYSTYQWAADYTTANLAARGFVVINIDTAGQTVFPTVDTNTTTIPGAAFEAGKHYKMIITTDDGTNVDFYFVKMN